MSFYLYLLSSMIGISSNQILGYKKSETKSFQVDSAKLSLKNVERRIAGDKTTP